MAPNSSCNLYSQALQPSIKKLVIISALQMEYCYWMCTYGLIAIHINNQIYTLNINIANCAKKFISNHRVGTIPFTRIVLGNLMKKSLTEDKSKTKTLEEEMKHQTIALHGTRNRQD